MDDRISQLVNELYGVETGAMVFERLKPLADRYQPVLVDNCSRCRQTLTEADSLLITYGDQIQEPGVRPLQTLREFCEVYLKGLIHGIHILPFFPFSSDDGFSVVDYRSVNPELGAWDDVAALGKSFSLMFDLVLNHISAQSDWFKAYLKGDLKFKDYFIEIKGDPDLSMVVRPRALPLLAEFDTPSGVKKVWTTFSTDQIDLNYRNPDVLLEMLDVILFYVSQGARFLRLDAVAYLWKEIGTSCIHLPQTHQVIRLFRAVLDSLCPEVSIITETNVPQKENLSYFGDGTGEAQLVYNFALPPLVLHTLQTGSAKALADWASQFTLPSSDVTFFNFLASHDGIGLNPARGILSEKEIDAMVKRVVDNGGLVSYKQNPDGSQSPYELNVNYFDALLDPQAEAAATVQTARFMAAQAIMLSLAGVPGIYFHSLVGSRGWPEGVTLTGRNRSINRQKLTRAALEKELQDPKALRQQVFARFANLLRARAATPAFHPAGRQDVLSGNAAVFALLRTSPDNRDRVFCLHNISNQTQSFLMDWQDVSGLNPHEMVDLLTGQVVLWQPEMALILQPYQVIWLKL